MDPSYRGEIRVILINHGRDRFYAGIWDRIAQLVIARYTGVVWAAAVEELSETSRGAGCLSSTGTGRELVRGSAAGAGL